MKTKTVCEIFPSDTNGRNSEGSFFTGTDGEILFAYSRYASAGTADDDVCDIALIRSRDNGESWSEYEIIARASDFGVKNIMCASAHALGRKTLRLLSHKRERRNKLNRTDNLVRRREFRSGTLSV